MRKNVAYWQLGCVAALAACMALAGCEPTESVLNSESGTAPTARPDAPPPVEVPDDLILPTDAELERRVPAQAGVGEKGSDLPTEGVGGAIARPAFTLFRVKERIVFEVQIPQAMSLFQAEHGKGPESHEEFMKKIIEANNIKLPELPAGQRYEYDVDKKMLMVIG